MIKDIVSNEEVKTFFRNELKAEKNQEHIFFMEAIQNNLWSLLFILPKDYVVKLWKEIFVIHAVYVER